MNFTLSELTNVDKLTFAWDTQRLASPYPPVVAIVHGQGYQVTGFGAEGSLYLVENVSGLVECLNLSVNLYGKPPTLPQLSRIYSIALKLGIDHSSIEIFTKEQIRGSKNLEILKNMVTLPQSVLDYIEEKNIPLKTVGLVTLLQAKFAGLIVDYIAQKKPSLQSFKRFMESLADFRDEALTTELKNFEFPSRKSQDRLKVESALQKLAAKINPVRVDNLSNFEKPAITFSVEISNMQDYEKAVSCLNEAREDAEAFFWVMKKHDLY